MRGLFAAGILIWALGALAAEVGNDATVDVMAVADGHTTAGADYWLKLTIKTPPVSGAVPVIVLHGGRSVSAQLFSSRDGRMAALPLATTLPGFLGQRDSVFDCGSGCDASHPIFAHIFSAHLPQAAVRFSASSLDHVLVRGTERARMIALSFGALMAVSAAALLIWFVLKDNLLILYATLFSLQALYVVYLSGQGFAWPWLSVGVPFDSFAWNIPAALSGAVACLFTREIADLKHFSPRVYKAFGWFGLAFVLLACANVGKFFGVGPLVNYVGNLMFLAAPIFTLAVCFLAWRRGNRAAGWFLIAWGLLEGFTMTVAAGFLTSGSDSDALYYSGLPFSMVAASILVALGVADRLRAQRAALTDAERRAQTDALTGVLNRRSLIERLDAACLRARTRGLPISLLFIDLDHFKHINDSFGHQAGDACLRAIIEPVHAELRQSDVIGRYGGEEFVVILSGADAGAALPIAERILKRVADVRVEGYGVAISLTCSIGIAASDMLGEWGEQLIARADAAVYVAKRAGRNQVQMAELSGTT